MRNMGFTVSYYKTLKRPAAKVNHIFAHLITLSDEKRGTMLLKGLKNEFCRK